MFTKANIAAILATLADKGFEPNAAGFESYLEVNHDDDTALIVALQDLDPTWSAEGFPADVTVGKAEDLEHLGASLGLDVKGHNSFADMITAFEPWAE